MNESSLGAFTPLQKGQIPLLYRLPGDDDNTQRQVDVPANETIAGLKRRITADLAKSLYDPTTGPRKQASPGIGGTTSHDLPGGHIPNSSPLPPLENGLPDHGTAIGGVGGSLGGGGGHGGGGGQQHNMSEQFNFDLQFGGTTLNPSSRIEEYNIPSTYEHAGTYLRTISNSNLPLEQQQKLLNSANSVVYSASKGVRDMKTLIEKATDGLGAEKTGEGFEMENVGEVGGGGEDNDPTAVAAALQTTLSKNFPDLFNLDPPERSNLEPITDGVLSEDRSLKRRASQSAAEQPSIKKIRDLRRKMKSRSAGEGGMSGIGGMGMSGIGGGSGIMGMGSAVWRGAGGGSTWLDDIGTTLKIEAVRRSGILEKSNEGSNLAKYLRDLENEPDDSVNNNKNNNKVEGGGQGISESMGDSSDEDSEEGVTESTENAETVPFSETSPNDGASATTRMTRENVVHHKSKSSDSTGKLTKRLSNLKVDPHTSAESVTQFTPGGVTGSMAINQQKPNLRPLPQSSTTSPISSSNNIARAVPIAPAPADHTRPPVVKPAPPAAPSKVKKKRGRKRKFPELSETERELYRKEQNRQSAKMSRVRRKKIAAEYEEKISGLVQENHSLKDEVSSLKLSLQNLQRLLTLSVAPTSGMQMRPQNPTAVAAAGTQDHQRGQQPFFMQQGRPQQQSRHQQQQQQQQQTSQNLPLRQPLLQQSYPANFVGTRPPVSGTKSFF